jgi:RNA polymerase sigma-70 factor, ECF subfamily
MDERALINSLKKGNPLSMRTIFDSHFNQLCRVAFRVVEDRDQAKDIVQAVFVKLWTRRESLEIKGSLESYLKRATFNTALNHLDERERKMRHMGNMSLNPATRSTADSEIQYTELKASVNTAISQLPNRTRSIFVLIRSEDMSYKEVADELQISTKAVEKEMMRALRMLREALKNFM